jgi:hypothetical protein
MAAILFLGTVCCLEVGHRLGNRKSENLDFAHEGIGASKQRFLRCSVCFWGLASAVEPPALNPGVN